MFTLLEAESEISKAQQKFEWSIRRDFRREATKHIGYPGGTTYDATVFTDGTFWFWSGDAKRKNETSPRRLNWFGIFRENRGLDISVEINVPYEGRNGKVAGFFARDNETGSIYLMHSGRVGGGTKGVGRSTFLTWRSEHLKRLIRVVDSTGRVREAIVVMPIEGKAAIRSAIRYVKIIDAFKQAVRNGETETADFKRRRKEIEDFYSESSGRRKGRRSGQIDYFSRHGDVVDALYLWRKSKPKAKGSRIVKNVLIDLGVSVKSKLVEVYEVKTSVNRQDIYTAIGQLFVHGTDQECKKFIVLPKHEKLASDLQEALDKLNIQVVNFKLNETKATII